MQHCKTCRHWQAPANDFVEVPRAGKCNAVPQFWNVTEWGEDGYTRKLKPKYADCRAFVQDGSDYYAELNTLHNFGCVQHEPRDEADPATR